MYDTAMQPNDGFAEHTPEPIPALKAPIEERLADAQSSVIKGWLSGFGVGSGTRRH
jgi:hypothetical protein